MTTKKERITLKAKEILGATPSGVRFSELVSRLRTEFPNDPYGTITGTVWNLDTRFPTEIYKPSRGLFRLVRFRSESAPVVPEPVAETTAGSGRTREVDFYQPFADYVVNDLEECTRAIPLGGNRFGSKWGTPDVFGILRSRESDIFKTPLEVVVAEVKIDTSQLITAFGQACAYKLFAHRSYLVVPRDSQPEDVARLDALCVIFGIGLILFDSGSPQAPDFEIRVRAAKHEPDSFYVNQCVRLIADELQL
ncbi:MAG TPA: hypothetical protein VFG80_04290 [Myxococcota bacterium]|nr:hypothetical protein [Myxococcota bacterium]